MQFGWGVCVPKAGAIAVMVVSASRVHREAIRNALQAQALCVTCGGSEDVLRRYTRQNPVLPTVVLIDLPAPEGPQLTAALTRVAHPAVIGMNVPQTGDLLAWAAAGAAGCLGIDQGVEALVSAVRKASVGQPVCSPELAASIFRQRPGRVPWASQESRSLWLTRREREILALVADDLTNKEIAERLCLEVSTVKNHLHRTFPKIGIRRRSEVRGVLNDLLKQVPES